MALNAPNAPALITEVTVGAAGGRSVKCSAKLNSLAVAVGTPPLLAKLYGLTKICC